MTTWIKTTGLRIEFVDAETRPKDFLTKDQAVSHIMRNLMGHYESRDLIRQYLEVKVLAAKHMNLGKDMSALLDTIYKITIVYYKQIQTVQDMLTATRGNATVEFSKTISKCREALHESFQKMEHGSKEE